MNIILDQYDKYKKASPVVKASFALLIANLVLKGLSLISGPIFTRIMPAEQFGIVSTFTSWKNVLSVIITLNLSSGVFNNGMLEFKEDRDTFQFSLQFLSSMIAVLGLIVVLFFRELLTRIFDIPITAIYLMFMGFLFVPSYNYWSGRQRYEYKYKALTIITISSAILSLVVGVFGVLHTADSNAAIVRIASIEGVSIVVGIAFFVVICIRARFHLNLRYCIYALKFNIPLIPHYLSMYILSSSDRIMITKIVDTKATAVYSVSYTVASVLEVVWNSIDASLSPWIYEKLAVGEKSKVRKSTMAIAILFAGMSLGCTLLAPEIMKILAPLSYYSGIYIIPPVSAGVFFIVIYTMYMRIELFYKQRSFAAIATTAAAILNIISNFVFIRLFGEAAAGYTTMVCYALLALFHYFNVKTRGYADIINNRAILVISFVVIVGALVVSLTFSFLIVRIIIILLLALAAVVKRKQILEAIGYNRF